MSGQRQDMTERLGLKETNTDMSVCPILCVYSPKGGVGKTTACEEIALNISIEGKKVLLIDCTSQRCLTRRLLKKKNNGTCVTLYDSIMSLHTARPVQEMMVEEINSGRIYFVPGHPKMHDLDGIIYSAENTMNMFPRNANYSGAMFYAIQQTARRYGVELVILDLSSNPGPLNRCLIMSSHYIVIPTDKSGNAPVDALYEYLCKEWIPYTRKVIARQTMQSMHPFPPKGPRLVGGICQSLRSPPSERLEHSLTKLYIFLNGDEPEKSLVFRRSEIAKQILNVVAW